MNKDKLNNTYIPHIRSQLRAANTILFTGAGFSLGAKNVLGETPPLAKDLKMLCWEICYGKEEVDDEFTLSDIYDNCLNKNPKGLASKVSQKLSIMTGSLEDWYRSYFDLPWLSAYTLNIDNLEEAASHQFQLNRRWSSLSATSEFTSQINQESSKNLQLIHLNGCLKDLPDKVRFSTIQYAEIKHDQDPWTLRLSNDLLSRSVIFVGTELNEPPLWHFLSLRGMKGRRGHIELRPRSYLVIPNLSRPKKALLDSFNIVHIPMTAEEFAHEVLSTISEDEVAEGLENLEQLYLTGKSASRPIDLKTVEINAQLKTEFLMGQEPIWSDITSGRAIETNFDEIIETTVKNELIQDKPKHIVVTGPAGSGKTTSLMRIALNLNAEGKHVYWIDRNTEITPGKILHFLIREKNIDVLAIDDSDLYGPSLTRLLLDLSQYDKWPLLIFEMRSHFIDRCFDETLLNSLKPIELVLPKLSDRDIERLIDTLDKDNRLGKLKGKSHVGRIASLRDLADRELVVAMYEATTGLKFREKVVDELNQLEQTAKSIYALTALAGTRRFSLSKQEILMSIDDSDNTVMNEIERLINRRLLVKSRTDKTLITCRHRVISEFVRSAAHQQGIMYPILYGLLRMAALKSYPHTSFSSKSRRILNYFINHEAVYELLDLIQSQKLYAELEPLLEHTHHFWLHRGALELEYGSLGHAENYLAQAMSLSEKDPLVRNEWAYLLFKKAITVPGSFEAPKLVEEAENILVDLIHESKSHPHPYHVLGSQGLLWSKKGIREIDKRRSFLERYEKYLIRGLREFPNNKKISEITQLVKREYLKTAVS